MFEAKHEPAVSEKTHAQPSQKFPFFADLPQQTPKARKKTTAEKQAHKKQKALEKDFGKDSGGKDFVAKEFGKDSGKALGEGNSEALGGEDGEALGVGSGGKDSGGKDFVAKEFAAKALGAEGKSSWRRGC